jgi:mRNA interferase MazF
MTDMLRGRIYRAHLSHIGADKFFLVVSNNRRNRAFEQVLAVRLTTTPPRDDRPAMVPLGPEEVMTGWVSCDDIETIYDDEASGRRRGYGTDDAPRRGRPARGLRHARLTGPRGYLTSDRALAAALTQQGLPSRDLVNPQVTGWIYVS